MDVTISIQHFQLGSICQVQKIEMRRAESDPKDCHKKIRLDRMGLVGNPLLQVGVRLVVGSSAVRPYVVDSGGEIEIIIAFSPPVVRYKMPLLSPVSSAVPESPQHKHSQPLRSDFVVCLETNDASHHSSVYSSAPSRLNHWRLIHMYRSSRNVHLDKLRS